MLAALFQGATLCIHYTLCEIQETVKYTLLSLFFDLCVDEGGQGLAIERNRRRRCFAAGEGFLRHPRSAEAGCNHRSSDRLFHGFTQFILVVFLDGLEILHVSRGAAFAVAGLADLVAVAIENERRRAALYAVFIDQFFVLGLSLYLFIAGMSAKPSAAMCPLDFAGMMLSVAPGSRSNSPSFTHSPTGGSPIVSWTYVAVVVACIFGCRFTDARLCARTGR